MAPPRSAGAAPVARKPEVLPGLSTSDHESLGVLASRSIGHVATSLDRIVYTPIWSILEYNIL